MTIGTELRPTFPGSADFWSINSFHTSPNKTDQTGKRTRNAVLSEMQLLQNAWMQTPVSGVKDLFFVCPATDADVLPTAFVCKDVSLPVCPQNIINFGYFDL